MQRKPAGFMNFVAWATLVIGVYVAAISLFGLLYLVFGGKAFEGLAAYVGPVLFGSGLAIAGWALLLGQPWSRFVFLAVSIVSLYLARRTLAVLALVIASGSFGHAFLALLTTMKWPIAAVVSTYLVFRHFREGMKGSDQDITETSYGPNP